MTQYTHAHHPLVIGGTPHPNTLVLDLTAGNTILMVLRTNRVIHHPIHLHGFKFEVLHLARSQTCWNFNCEWPEITEVQLKELAKSPPHLLKDTIDLAAGSLAVIRFSANNPGWWFAHCHYEVHAHDGLAWVNNVLNRSTSEEDSYFIPSDYPKCFNDREIEPSCDCFVSSDIA